MIDVEIGQLLGLSQEIYKRVAFKVRSLEDENERLRVQNRRLMADAILSEANAEESTQPPTGHPKTDDLKLEDGCSKKD